MQRSDVTMAGPKLLPNGTSINIRGGYARNMSSRSTSRVYAPIRTLEGTQHQGVTNFRLRHAAPPT